jgi:hypothetical protein
MRSRTRCLSGLSATPPCQTAWAFQARYDRYVVTTTLVIAVKGRIVDGGEAFSQLAVSVDRFIEEAPASD